METIKVKKYSDVIEELTAAGAITPGMLLALNSSGAVKAHDELEGNVLPMFALEDELQGGGIDDDYASGDPVQVWIPGRGDIVNAILKDGETATIGAWLASGGDGTLVVHTPDAETVSALMEVRPLQVVGQAVSAVDMSGSSGVDPDGRILVRIV